MDGSIGITTTTATSITTTTATIGGNIPSDNGTTITERGLCISKLPTPTITNKMVNGSGMGSFATNITSLTPNTTYYVRAYATNIMGTSYGNEVIFTTLNGIVTLSTANATTINATTASISCNISDDGGVSVSERGLCFSLSPNPTISNKKINGSGIGSYSTSIAGLTANTTYYVRAYAVNNVGTFYGNEINFTTIDGINFNPNLTYGTMTDVEGNIYKTITIGTQTWMAENLKTTKYNDGTSIYYDSYSDPLQWPKSSAAYTWNSNNIKYKDVFGALYNWHAVNTGKLAPKGWHVPSDYEWAILMNNIIDSDKLKETGTAHWQPNSGATNVTGFTALPSDYRDQNGYFNSGYPAKSGDGLWWSTSNFYYVDSAISFKITNQNNTLNSPATNKSYGLSVRCIKD